MCEHPETITCDGFVVCRHCSFVLSDAILAPEEEEFTIQICHLNDFIDFCHRGEIPIIYAQDMQQLFCEHVHCISASQKNTLKALCLYETLKNQHIARTLREVSALTGESVKSMGSLLKKVFPHSKDIDPKQLLSRFAGKLGLTRRQVCKIEKQFKITPTTVNPSSVVAGLIAKFVSNESLGIHLNEISDVCGVTCVAIRRYLNQNKET